MRRLGTMLDCSRNAVMTVDSVKKWIDLTSSLGFNMLMLYTEDTYEIPDEPYFGYCRGRYRTEELKEMKRYAGEKGMELIPCIQTLAHLNGLTRWPAYRPHVDIDDILLADDEAVYDLIEKMFTVISECFDSVYVNVGMDEAFHIGRGRYYDLHGDADRTGILLRHVKKVAEIGKKHGLKLCMWSDMFFRLAAGTYYADSCDIANPEVSREIPDNVELIYWDYYSADSARYDRMLRAHEKLRPGTWFAGGLWSWEGFAPHNAFSMNVTRAALTACADNSVENCFFTLWGDDGAECSRFALLPALFYASELAKGIFDEAQIRREFESRFGISWDHFMLLDLPDSPNGRDDKVINAEKYLFYNDPFLGLMDSTLQGDEADSFARCAEKLRAVPRSQPFAYLFDTQQALCEVLAEKADLGVRIRAAYGAGDRDALRAAADSCRVVEERLAVFYECFRRQWYLENKGQGFEVQDIRLGGLRQRVAHCRRMLEDLLSGQIERIDELEEALLDVTGNGTDYRKEALLFNSWRQTVTANVISHS